MNPLRNNGIHARLLFAAMVIITTTTFILGYFSLDMVKRLVSERFDHQINYMAEHLATNAELGILIHEQPFLEALANTVLNEKDVIGVEIEDEQGNLLAQQTRPGGNDILITEKTVRISRAETDPVDLDFMAGHTDNGIIGRVKISYTRQGINDLTSSMAKRFTILSLGLAAFSCLIFFLISRSLVSPVISLARVARKVSQGDRSLRAPLGTLPETRRLALAFNEMLDSMEESRQALVNAQGKLSRQEALAEVGKFSMMIAHEVKNPLAIIKASLDMLKKELNIPRDNLLLNYTEEELVRLNQLIESFLMFSHPTKARLVSTDLNLLVEQVAGGFQLQYNSLQLAIHCATPGTPYMAPADADLFARGLSNIIRNACEASDCRGRIDIETKTTPGKAWAVLVRDHGAGIDADTADKLFEPFYTTKTTGTGLGLAFVDQVVKAHGGTLSAFNHEDGGAVFCMELPLENRHAGGTGEPEY